MLRMDSDLDGWIDFPGKRLDCRDQVRRRGDLREETISDVIDFGRACQDNLPCATRAMRLQAPQYLGTYSSAEGAMVRDSS